MSHVDAFIDELSIDALNATNDKRTTRIVDATIDVLRTIIEHDNDSNDDDNDANAIDEYVSNVCEMQSTFIERHIARR